MTFRITVGPDGRAIFPKQASAESEGPSGATAPSTSHPSWLPQFQDTALDAMRRAIDRSSLASQMMKLTGGSLGSASKPSRISTAPPGRETGVPWREYAREVVVVDHAKAAQAEREKAMVEALENVLNTLQAMRQGQQEEKEARVRMEQTVRDHEEQLARYRTGAPGRPGSGHLIEEEFERRAASRAIEPTLSEQGRVLVDWLQETHPQVHPIKPRTVENMIRASYHRARRISRHHK